MPSSDSDRHRSCLYQVCSCSVSQWASVIAASPSYRHRKRLNKSIKKQHVVGWLVPSPQMEGEMRETSQWGREGEGEIQICKVASNREDSTTPNLHNNGVHNSQFILSEERTQWLITVSITECHASLLKNINISCAAIQHFGSKSTHLIFRVKPILHIQKSSLAQKQHEDTAEPTLMTAVTRHPNH